MSRKVVALAVLVAAFGALAGVVVAGGMQWLDQYAVDHWMPGFTPTEPNLLDWRGLWRPFTLDTTWWEKLLSVWTYPASFLVSGLLVGGACVFLWRRGQPRIAAIWAAAWVAGNGLELAGKEALDRPRLRWTERGSRVSIPSFHDSFPSGHTIRALLVAALIVFLWRRALWPAIAWVALVPVFLVVLSDHTPSDVLGGLLVGLALVLGVQLLATPR